MNPSKRTAHYTLINVAYFAAYSSAHAYAAVFLLDRGFSNTAIGIVLALANIMSVILQPFTAGLIDKYESFTNRKVSIFCALSCIICSAFLYFVKAPIAAFILYVTLYMLQMIYQPLIQALNFEYNAKGDKINFGLARGLGSCGFAVTSLIIGQLLVRYSISVLQIVNIIAFSMGVLALFTFFAPKGETKIETVSVLEDESQDESVAHNSLGSFIKTYPMFMLYVLGGTLLFFEHNALNDYLIQIITPLGGDESTMGTMVMIAALLELPTMAFFAKAEKKVGLKKILCLSAIMFTVKTLLMFFATNLVVAYISQVCQIFAYALFIPSGAYLAERVMEKNDKTKGQSYINCAITLGGVFSALVCGRLIDILDVHMMLLVSCIVGALGTVISLVAVRKIKI